MSETPGVLPNANEADALEQAQSVDGRLDDSSEELELDESPPTQAASRWDADEADVIEQAKTVKPARDEEYPDDEA